MTPAYAAANLAGLVGVVVFFFGFQALREYMSDTPVRRWAFLGMVSSTAGMGLYLPFLGIFTFAGPAAARLYLSGDQRAMAVVVDGVSPSNPTALIFGGLSILLFVAGSIIFAGCIWQCGKLPKWSGVPYAIAAPSIIPVYSFVVAFLGSIVLLSSGMLIAMNVWKDHKRSGRQTPMALFLGVFLGHKKSRRTSTVNPSGPTSLDANYRGSGIMDPLLSWSVLFLGRRFSETILDLKRSK